MMGHADRIEPGLLHPANLTIHRILIHGGTQNSTVMMNTAAPQLHAFAVYDKPTCSIDRQRPYPESLHIIIQQDLLIRIRAAAFFPLLLDEGHLCPVQHLAVLRPAPRICHKNSLPDHSSLSGS